MMRSRQHSDDRKRRPDGESHRRRKRGLHRLGRNGSGNSQLVARVGGKRILGHEWLGHLLARGLNPALDIDVRQFGFLRLRSVWNSCRSRARSARSVSACELTDTYSPAAIDMEPATSPAMPVISTSFVE